MNTFSLLQKSAKYCLVIIDCSRF